MARFFDPKLYEAIDILWMTEDFNKGAYAQRIIEQLVENGDKDACFFLARSYAGPCYVNKKFGFISLYSSVQSRKYLGGRYAWYLLRIWSWSTGKSRICMEVV